MKTKPQIDPDALLNMKVRIIKQTKDWIWVERLDQPLDADPNGRYVCFHKTRDGLSFSDDQRLLTVSNSVYQIRIEKAEKYFFVDKKKHPSMARQVISALGLADGKS